jgi:hypothetical protein
LIHPITLCPRHEDTKNVNEAPLSCPRVLRIARTWIFIGVAAPGTVVLLAGAADGMLDASASET